MELSQHFISIKPTISRFFFLYGPSRLVRIRTLVFLQTFEEVSTEAWSDSVSFSYFSNDLWRDPVFTFQAAATIHMEHGILHRRNTDDIDFDRHRLSVARGVAHNRVFNQNR